MPRRLHVHPHLPHEHVIERFQDCKDGFEKLKWQAIMLVEEGWSTAQIVKICKRSASWVRDTVYDYNAHGPEGLCDKRAFNGSAPYLSVEQMKELRSALNGSPPDGGIWTGAKVSRWIESKINHSPINDATGWDYLQRLGWSPKVPRPAHPDADPQAQDAFKKGGFLIRWNR